MNKLIDKAKSVCEEIFEKEKERIETKNGAIIYNWNLKSTVIDEILIR